MLNSLARLRTTAPHIAPSLLLCDFANLEREIGRFDDAGVEIFHLDVMDGYFVPNLTYGMPIVQAFRKLTDRLLDAHLMITDPGRYVPQFVEAGADCITIHAEAATEPAKVLEQIRSFGVAAGLAINPETPLSQVADCLDLCDLVLAMSVKPGFGGQKFNPVALEKLRELQNLVGPEVLLEIDGGINEETIAESVDAGAHLLVVGSAIFNHQDYRSRVRHLKSLAVSREAATE